MIEHTAFVSAGKSSKDTAVLLVGTAREFGIGQDHIKMVPGGFRITEELADVLYAETQEPAKKPAAKKTSKTSTTKKPSGNRAAKNVTNKE